MTVFLNTLHRFAWFPRALLVSSLLAAAGGYLVAPKPPVEFRCIKASPDVVKPGGVVKGAYHSVRNRTCKECVQVRE